MALRRSNLREVIIPETVKNISKDAFAGMWPAGVHGDLRRIGVKLYVPENPVYRKVEKSAVCFIGTTQGSLQL